MSQAPALFDESRFAPLPSRPDEHLLDTVGDSKLPITIHSGEGALIWDLLGRHYWDFYGGHAVTFIGQGHPRWVEAIARQARQLAFFTTIGPTPIRDRAASALCKFTGMDKVFLVNSGAEANEAALKIARKATGRSVIVAMDHGFHGRTMGALGVTWKYRDAHSPAHGPTRLVPFGDLAALESALDGDVAAVLTETVQGMAGVVLPPAGWLRAVADLCKSKGVMLILDEVQCGIGRMGVPLACMREGVRPDLVTVGKGVGGGFPAAACLMTDAVAATIKPGDHGTTFGGGPLACAAIEVTLDIIQSEGLMERAQRIGERMQEKLSAPAIKELRGAGAWWGVVLDRPAKPVMLALIEKGFLTGTSSDPNVLRLAPSAVMPLYAVDGLAEAMRDVLR